MFFTSKNVFSSSLSWDKEQILDLLMVILSGALDILPAFWNFALFSVDKNPITAGKILVGLTFLVGGYISIRILVSLFERKVLRRLDIEISKRYTIKILMFYFLISLLFLFTLYLVRVPLTVFTVVGGALALGVGFGAKNIMNNFISGIAIVIEHPIRVGDLIEIDKLIGVVEHIGFRATTIKSLDNINILIPNSFLLEHNILNWTLSDTVIRSQVKVGIQYGSDVEKAQKILLQIADDHEKILSYNKNQKPVVIFEDFGDNSLVFNLIYWIAIERLIDIKMIASEIRFSINKSFEEAGIVIAFPQRDLHIKEPVQVELANKQTPPL